MNKTPILSDEQMFRAAKGAYGLVPGSKEVWKGDVTGFSIACRIAYAQRDAVVRWLCEVVEGAENSNRKRSNDLSESVAYFAVEEFRQGLLALLQGDSKEGQ